MLDPTRVRIAATIEIDTGKPQPSTGAELDADATAGSVVDDISEGGCTIISSAMWTDYLLWPVG